MGLLEVIRGLAGKEKVDPKLRDFLLKTGFEPTILAFPESRIPLLVGKPLLIDVQTPGEYNLAISLNPDEIKNVFALRFKAGSYMLEPIFIRRIHEVDTLFGPAKEYGEVHATVRRAKLGTKLSYERAKELATSLKNFEADALFRDLAATAHDDPDDTLERENRKSKWPKFAGIAAAATVALTSFLIYQNSKQTEKIDQSSKKLDYLVDRSIADHAKYNDIIVGKYFAQNDLAAELDAIGKKAISLSALSNAETGIKYYPPVHDEREGTYNWYLISKEAWFNYLEFEHTGQIVANKEFSEIIKRFSLEKAYAKITEAISSRRDFTKAAEIHHGNRLKAEAKPFEQRLSEEYRMPVKVKIERTPARQDQHGYIAGSQSISMELDNSTVEYYRTSFYIKVGEEPIGKNPLYAPNPNQKPIEGVTGTLKLDNGTFARFDADNFLGVKRKDIFYEHNDKPKPEEQKELLRQGLRAFNDFREKYKIDKFLKIAKEWVDK